MSKTMHVFFALFLCISTASVVSACPANCDMCSDPSSCINCQSGYMLDETTLTCTACPVNCANCDEEVCYDCKEGYFLDNAASPAPCTACPVNCANCDEQVCYDCKEGYFLENVFSPTPCTACPVNCDYCSRDGCNQCKNGYFLDATAATCTACPSSCEGCTNATNCIACSSGLYRQFGACMTSFPVGCVKYHSPQGYRHGCTACDDGFFLQYSIYPEQDCFACPPGCEACTPYSCSACSSGYYFDNVTSCIAYVHQIHVLLDLSGSISIPGGELALKTFVHSTMVNLNKILPSTRVLSIFSDSVEEVYRDSEPGDDLGDAIYNMNVSSRGGPTQTAAALEHVQLQVEDVVGCKMILILTDGGSVDPTATSATAQELREDYNIGVCVVPMGQISCEGQDELHNLAGDSGLVVHNFKNMLDPQAAYTTAQSCLDAVCAGY